MPQLAQNPIDVLGRPLELPCGVVLKNRLIKSAMSDSLGDGGGNPTGAQMKLYERWAEGGAALLLIGEVQGDPRYPEKPGNLVLVPDADLQAMQALARRGSVNGAHIWPQLGHAGALSHLPISRPKGPSALDIEGLRCQGMSLDDIHDLPGHLCENRKARKGCGLRRRSNPCGPRVPVQPVPVTPVQSKDRCLWRLDRRAVPHHFRSDGGHQAGGWRVVPDRHQNQLDGPTGGRFDQ